MSSCPSQFFYYFTGSAVRCVTLCPPGTLGFNNSQLGQKECVASCPAKSYVDLSAGYCYTCYASCLTCSGSSATNCLSCDLTSAFPVLSPDRQCLSVCSSSQYVLVNAGGTKCYTVCPVDTYALTLGGNQCVASCPTTTYLLGRQCEICDKSCATCTGQGNYNCDKCSVGYIKYQSQCVNACPFGYKESAGQCIPACHQDTCVGCQGNDVYTCLQCLPGFLLYQATCYYTCPEGSYQYQSSCLPCEKTCRTCKGSNGYDCVSCPDMRYLYKGACVTTCPEGLQPINGRCQVPIVCQPPCSTCLDNTAEICGSCESTTPYLVNSTCYVVCPSHYYATNGTRCDQCNSACGNCFGSFAFNCLSCPKVTSAVYYLSPYGSCSTSCPTRYYANNDTYICTPINYFPVPQLPNITLPITHVPSSVGHPESGYYPVSTLAASFLVFSAVAVASKLSSPQSLPEANLLAFYSAVDMFHRFGLVVSLWRYGDTEAAPYEVAICAGLLMGSICLSMMFLVLYMDPVFETSAALDVVAEQHKRGLKIMRVLCHVCGLHFVRLLYGGLFSLPLFSNFKTMGNSSAFRLPLEKLSSVHLFALLIPQILQNITVLLFYQVNSDPFQIAVLGIAVDLAIAGIYLFDYYRGPWRS